MSHHLYTQNLGKTWGSFKANSDLSLHFLRQEQGTPLLGQTERVKPHLLIY